MSEREKMGAESRREGAAREPAAENPCSQPAIHGEGAREAHKTHSPNESERVADFAADAAQQSPPLAPAALLALADAATPENAARVDRFAKKLDALRAAGIQLETARAGESTRATAADWYGGGSVVADIVEDGGACIITQANHNFPWADDVGALGALTMLDGPRIAELARAACNAVPALVARLQAAEARAAAAERDRDALLAGFTQTSVARYSHGGQPYMWRVYLHADNRDMRDLREVAEFDDEASATAAAARWQALIDTARSARSNAKEA